MASEIKVDTIVNAGGDNDSGIDLATNDNIKFNIAGSQKAIIDSSGKIGINTSSPTSTLTVKAFEDSVNGGIRFESNDGSENATIDFNDSAALRFRTNGSDRMRVDSNGNFLIGKTATGTSNTGCQFEPSGTGVFSRSGDICMVLNRETNAGECVSIRQGGTAVGGIDANSSSVDFNTSSDYRLKENLTTSWDATTRLKQLKPVRFSWKVDNKSEADTDGFLAHEVSSVVPQAISGEKDAVDADGKPKHQGIDHSKLVALLVKTVQELEARIATLESK